MKGVIAILAAALFLSGCGPDIWDKPDATQADFNQDQGACQMYAMSMPQATSQQLPPTYTAQTTYTGYGAYTTVQAQPNPGQGLADLGTALGNAARQKQAMRSCMMAKGYTLEKK